MEPSFTEMTRCVQIFQLDDLQSLFFHQASATTQYESPPRREGRIYRYLLILRQDDTGGNKCHCCFRRENKIRLDPIRR